MVTRVGKCPHFSHHPTLGDSLQQIVGLVMSKKKRKGRFPNPCGRTVFYPDANHGAGIYKYIPTCGKKNETLSSFGRRYIAAP